MVKEDDPWEDEFFGVMESFQKFDFDEEGQMVFKDKEKELQEEIQKEEDREGLEMFVKEQSDFKMRRIQSKVHLFKSHPDSEAAMQQGTLFDDEFAYEEEDVKVDPSYLHLSFLGGWKVEAREKYRVMNLIGKRRKPVVLSFPGGSLNPTYFDEAMDLVCLSKFDPIDSANARIIIQSVEERIEQKNIREIPLVVRASVLSGFVRSRGYRQNSDLQAVVNKF